MFDMVVMSFDLHSCVLDAHVKRGAELPTDRHLVVSSICWLEIVFLPFFVMFFLLRLIFTSKVEVEGLYVDSGSSCCRTVLLFQ